MQRHIRAGLLMLFTILASLPLTAAQMIFARLPPLAGLLYLIGLTALTLTLWIRWQRTAWKNALARPTESWQVVLMATVCSAALGAAYHHWVHPGVGLRIERLEDSAVRNASLCIVALGTGPLIEEALFRGFLLPRLCKTYGVTTAVMLSAVTFGVAHDELARIVQPLLGGLVLGAIVACTGRLWLAAIAHSLFNASGMLEVLAAKIALADRLGILYPILCITVAAIAALELRRVLVTTRWCVAPNPASLVAPPTTWGLDLQA